MNFNRFPYLQHILKCRCRLHFVYFADARQTLVKRILVCRNNQTKINESSKLDSESILVKAFQHLIPKIERVEQVRNWTCFLFTIFYEYDGRQWHEAWGMRHGWSGCICVCECKYFLALLYLRSLPVSDVSSYLNDFIDDAQKVYIISFITSTINYILCSMLVSLPSNHPTIQPFGV